MSIKQITTYINAIYIIFVIIIDFAFPKFNFISLSNLLLPLSFIGSVYVLREYKFIYQFLGVISLLCGCQIFINFFHPPLTLIEISFSVRPIKIATILFAAIQLQNQGKAYTLTLIKISYLILTIITALQLLNVDLFIDLYASQEESAEFIKYSLIDARVTGVFLNPNNLGFFALLLGLFFYRTKDKDKWLFLTISMILILFSQSRTILITSFIIVGIEFVRIFILTKKRKINYWVLLISITSVITITLSLPNTRSLILGSAFKSNSFTTRIKIIEEVIDVNSNTILIGQGHVSKIPQVVGGSIDNEYAFEYLEYGLIGLILILGAYVLTLFAAWKHTKDIFIPLSFITFLIVGFTNLSFSNYEIIPIYVVLCTEVIGTKMCKKEKLK